MKEGGTGARDGCLAEGGPRGKRASVVRIARLCLGLSVCPRFLFPLIVSSNSSSSNRHRRRRCKWDYADPALQTALYSSHPRPVPPWDELTIDRIDTVAAAGGHVCWKRVFRPRPRRLYLPRKIASPLPCFPSSSFPCERLPPLSLFSITRLLRGGGRGLLWRDQRSPVFPYVRSLYLFSLSLHEDSVTRTPPPVYRIARV